MLEAIGLIEETSDGSVDGNPYYILNASSKTELPEIEQFRDEIDRLADAPAVELELAATYDAFRETGSDHDDALERVRRKKGSNVTMEGSKRPCICLKNLGLERNRKNEHRRSPRRRGKVAIIATNECSLACMPAETVAACAASIR